jgi:segregation and condensation protein B
VEAVIFCASEPVTPEEIRLGLSDNFQTELSQELIDSVISDLVKKFESDDSSFELMESGGGYQFLSKPAFQSSVSAMWKQKIKKRLSTSALETLSIIAYKQPVTKPEIEKIRGVNCDYAVQKLLEKELIQIKGRSKDPGRPLLYGTSDKFMEHFGLPSLQDLPKLKELQPEENQIGQLDELDENQ